MVVIAMQWIHLPKSDQIFVLINFYNVTLLCNEIKLIEVNLFPVFKWERITGLNGNR